MGAESSSVWQPEQPQSRRWVSTEVKLVVYDLDGSAEIFVLNQLLRPLGTGIFHCGVQVLGQEWSFRGGRREGSGIFSCLPGTCAGLVPRETVKLGAVMLPEGKVASILEQMKHQWPSRGYDMLRRNCSHFCDDFCQRLGVGTLPEWVKNMASTGADIASLSSQVSGTLKSFWETEEEAPPSRPMQRFGPRIQSRQIGEAPAVPARGGSPMPLMKETHVLHGVRSSPTLLTMRGPPMMDVCRSADLLQDDEEVVQCCF